MKPYRVALGVGAVLGVFTKLTTEVAVGTAFYPTMKSTVFSFDKGIQKQVANSIMALLAIRQFVFIANAYSKENETLEKWTRAFNNSIKTYYDEEYPVDAWICRVGEAFDCYLKIFSVGALWFFSKMLNDNEDDYNHAHIKTWTERLFIAAIFLFIAWVYDQSTQYYSSYSERMNIDLNFFLDGLTDFTGAISYFLTNRLPGIDTSFTEPLNTRNEEAYVATGSLDGVGIEGVDSPEPVRINREHQGSFGERFGVGLGLFFQSLLKLVTEVLNAATSLYGLTFTANVFNNDASREVFSYIGFLLGTLKLFELVLTPFVVKENLINEKITKDRGSDSSGDLQKSWFRGVSEGMQAPWENLKNIRLFCVRNQSADEQEESAGQAAGDGALGVSEYAEAAV